MFGGMLVGICWEGGRIPTGGIPARACIMLAWNRRQTDSRIASAAMRAAEAGF
jgi:hypothetical protein